MGKLGTEEAKDRLKVTRLDRQDPGVNPAIRPRLLWERDSFWGKWGLALGSPRALRVCRAGRKQKERGVSWARTLYSRSTCTAQGRLVRVLAEDPR